MSSDDVGKLVQGAADRFAILDLVTTYSLATDEQDWERVAALFTDDANWEYATPQKAGLQRGPTAITAAMRSAMAPVTASQHTNSNHLVRLLGDDAEHTCYFVARLVGQSGSDIRTIGGRYDDRLVRAPGGWLFAHRTVTPSWSTGSLFPTGPER